MVNAVSPLSGVTGRFIDETRYAPADVMQGNTVDPKHSQPGETAQPYPYQKTAWGDSPYVDFYGTDTALVGEPVYGLVAGTGEGDATYDQTPYGTHAAPWPKNPAGDGSTSPDNIARQLQQSRIIHGVRTNASGRSIFGAQGLEAQQDEWVEYASVAKGTTLQPTGVPQSVGTTVGGWGSRDSVNSRARQNDIGGFGDAHHHRRVATGKMPLNFLWMGGKGRPMVRTLPGSNRLPIGPNSPFSGDNPGDTFRTQGAVLTGTPPDYVPPPVPDTAPAPTTGTAPVLGADTDWW